MSTYPNGSLLPDTDRILADFFADEAPQYEPPVLLPAVLARTALTRRRPAWRIPSWWLPASIAWRPRTPGTSNTMFTLLRLVSAGAVLALASGLLLATLSGSPTPGSPPIQLPDQTDLVSGTTYFLDGGWGVDSPRFIFTVPAAGWYARTDGNFGRDLADVADDREILITPWNPRNLYVDPCHYLSAGELDPPVGPTVDDLAAGLMQQAAGNASTPTDVTVGGFPGKKVGLSLPAGVHITALDVDPGFTVDGCEGGAFWRWEEGYSQGGQGGHLYLDGQRNTVYILDLGGRRVVIDTIYALGTSEADLAEVERLVASIRFELPAPSPSPST